MKDTVRALQVLESTCRPVPSHLFRGLSVKPEHSKSSVINRLLGRAR
jgi:hypothetical protein